MSNDVSGHRLQIKMSGQLYSGCNGRLFPHLEHSPHDGTDLYVLGSGMFSGR